MPTDNELLTAELGSMAEEPRLGRGVSAQRAVSEGRRIVRRRRVIGTTSGVGASGLALLLAVCLMPMHGRAAGDGSGPQPGPADAFTAPVETSPSALLSLPVTGPPVGVPTNTGSPVGTSPARPPNTPGDDPLVATAAFGWLPANFTVDGYNTDPAQPAGDIGPNAGTYSSVFEISAQTQDGTQKTSAALLPPGVAPAGPNVGQLLPAGSIGVGSAYWQTTPADQARSAGETILDWQYKANDWAELSLTLDSTGQSTTTTENAAKHIAQQMRFGRSQPIALPFRRVTAPQGLTTATAGWALLNPGIIADATWEETLSFANGPLPTGSSAGSDSGYSSLEFGVTGAELPAADAGFTDDYGGSPQTTNTTVAGLPATIMTSPGYTLLTINNAKGFGTVDIQGTGTEATALAAPGAAAAVFDQLQLLGTEQGAWTTDVVG